MQRIEVSEINPNGKHLREIAEKMNSGAVVIMPTDSLYAIGCVMTNRQGVERICKILEKPEKKARMSLLLPSISEISKYTVPIDNHVFKTMKRYLPGPYTFILKSNKVVQKFFKNNKEEVGVRIPDSEILMELHQYLDAPIISASLKLEGEEPKAFYDPMEIEEQFKHDVDILIDGGIGEMDETTVLDCTVDGEIELIRQGKGLVD